MKQRPARICLFAVLVVALVGVMIWGWRGGPITGEVPITSPVSNAAPTARNASPLAPTAQSPSVQEVPSIAAPTKTLATTAPLNPSVPEAPSPPVAEPMADIDSAPRHIEIFQGDGKLVGSKITHIQMNAKGELNPPKGFTGWYGPPQWSTTPGNLSDHPAVLAGHVTYDGAPDVFYYLSKVKKGDRVVITYENGSVATFSVDAPAHRALKDDVTVLADSTYAWVWNNEKPGRKISLFTCDPTQGIDLSGHSLYNWVVQATRIN